MALHLGRHFYYYVLIGLIHIWSLISWGRIFSRFARISQQIFISLVSRFDIYRRATTTNASLNVKDEWNVKSAEQFAASWLIVTLEAEKIDARAQRLIC